MKKIILLLTSSLILLTGASESKNQVKGTVIYSFSDSHFLIQTETHVLRVQKSKISAQDAEAFKSIGQTVSLSIPKNAIDLAWRFTNSPIASAVRIEKITNDRTLVKNDKFEIRGTPLPSFNDAHYMIRSGNHVYRIKAAEVPETEKEKLRGVGTQVQVALPIHAVDFSWKVTPDITPEAGRKIASIQTDDFKKTGDQLFISGTLLPSFNEPHVLVQSGGRVYMLNPKEFGETERGRLSKMGSQVSLTARPEAIIMSWPVQ